MKMKDTRERQTESAGCMAAVVVFVLFLLPVVYVLSLGPAAVLVQSDAIDEEPANIFFFPLIWLNERSETVQAALQWYVKLWVGP